MLLWAMDEAPVTDPQSLVLLQALAECASEDGTGAYPSQSTLARRGRCSLSTVGRYLAAMERDGIIRRGDQELTRKYPANRRPVVWDLCIGAVDNVTSQSDWAVKSDGLPSQNRSSDPSLVTDKPKSNQEINPDVKRRSIPISPLLASLRAEQPLPAPECGHGLKPWRCPQCT